RAAGAAAAVPLPQLAVGQDEVPRRLVAGQQPLLVGPEEVVVLGVVREGDQVRVAVVRPADVAHQRPGGATAGAVPLVQLAVGQDEVPGRAGAVEVPLLAGAVDVVVLGVVDQAAGGRAGLDGQALAGGGEGQRVAVRVAGRQRHHDGQLGGRHRLVGNGLQHRRVVGAGGHRDLEGLGVGATAAVAD